MDLVIFDMDGVLVDTEPTYVATNRKIYDELGVTITDEEYRSFVGIASDKKWSYIKEKGNLSLSLSELMQLSKDRKYMVFSQIEVKCFDGIKSLLTSIKNQSVKLALASSNSRKMVDLITHKAKLKKYFDIMVSGEDIKNGKPSPDIFLTTARHCNVQPSKCIVVEDSKNGLLAAKAAGMKCIAYNGPAPYPQDFSEADDIIDDYSKHSIFRVLSHITQSYS